MAKTQEKKKTSASKPAAKKSAVKKPVTKKSGGAAVSSARNRNAPSIAFFIDLDNTNASVTNATEIISILQNHGNIVYGKFFGYTDAVSGIFEELVHEHKIETAGKLRFKNDNVSVIDLRLVMESVALTEKNGYDTVFIWTGVGDLIPLFARLQELNAKTFTVDLPEFDCKNKFVDQAVRLFSPHSLKGARQLGGVIIPSNTRNVVVSDFNSVPELPRKKGAPAFGEGVQPSLSNEDSEAEMTESERNNFFMNVAANVYRELEKETKVINPNAEFAELTQASKTNSEQQINNLEHQVSDLEKKVNDLDYNVEESMVVVDTIPVEEPTSEFNDFGDFGSLSKVPTGKGE